MDAIQLMTTVTGCANPMVVLHADNYEVMRTWLDFLFGKLGFAEVNNTVTAWVAKNNPNLDLNMITQSIRECAAGLMRARGA